MGWILASIDHRVIGATVRVLTFAAAVLALWTADAADADRRADDRFAAKEHALSLAVKSASSDKEKLQVISDALALVDEAVEADDFAAAQRVLALLAPSVKGVSDKDSVAEVARSKRRVAQLDAAYAKARPALDALKSKPDDPQANFAVGWYYCFLKGQWDTGLPMLAEGTDAAVKRAAKADLDIPIEPAEQLAVADGWWKVADNESGVAKAQILLRARMWYKRVLPELSELAQDRIHAKIESIDKLAASSGVGTELALEAVPTAGVGRLSPYQRERANQLIADFRRQSNSPADQDATVTKLLEIGGPPVSQLLTTINKDLQPRLRQYGERFAQEAARLAATKTSGDHAAQIEKLRATVLALRERAELTKEAIVAEGDPAMRSLESMLVVDRSMVLERSPQLGAERAKLVVLGRHWERSATYIVAHLEPAKTAARKTDAARSDGGKPESKKPTDAPADADPRKPSEVSVPNFDKYLRGEEDMATKMAMPMPAGARAVLEANAKLIDKIDHEEGRAILACNLTRQLLGLPLLTIDLKLCAAARDHSTDMQTLKFFSHTSPVPGKVTAWDRAKNFGASASGENIAMGYADGNAANQGWFHSPGHHKNMLGNHSRIGLGASGSYFTEMFGN